MTSEVTVRELTGAAEFAAAAALYRSGFGYTDPAYGLSPRLLAGLRANSGSVIGAFEPDGALVGFCFGFTAVEHGEIYHYSQAAVVDPRLRGGGVGRRLKQHQATVARGTGARTMRWTFDPYALRNAHFNLAVLGATGIRFLPDHYGGGTDRVLVSWDLQAGRADPTPAGRADRAPAGRTDRAPAGRTDRADQAPAGRTVLASATGHEAATDAGDRDRLRRELVGAFEAGGRLVAVTRQDDRVIYAFTRAPS